MQPDRLDPNWRSRFVLSREAVTPGEARRLARFAAFGQLRRVIRGVYSTQLSTDGWHAELHHLERVRAHHVVSATPMVFARASAAAVWGLPRIGPWPGPVEVVSERAPGGRSASTVRKLGVGVPEAVVIDGIAVTGLARTIVDLARSERVESAVASADAALRGVEQPAGRLLRVSKDELRAELAVALSARGTRAAAWVIDFADGDAQLPGESLSRVQMHRMGLAAPELQRRFVDEEGEMFSDFWFKDAGVIGEFDGFGKYLRIAPALGLSAADAVVAEMRREDRLRRQPGVTTVVRWGWSTARNRARLEALLRRAGVT